MLAVTDPDRLGLGVRLRCRDRLNDTEGSVDSDAFDMRVTTDVITTQSRKQLQVNRRPGGR
jgi:hypothetical protein